MKLMNYLVRKTKKDIGKFKVETPKSIWIDEFVCLKSKAYSFKCKDNIVSKNKKKFLNLNENILNLKNIKNVWMERNIKANVIIIF